MQNNLKVKNELNKRKASLISQKVIKRKYAIKERILIKL